MNLLDCMLGLQSARYIFQCTDLEIHVHRVVVVFLIKDSFVLCNVWIKEGIEKLASFQGR